MADGTYDGYPDLGVQVVNLENPAARRDSKLGPEESGVRVEFVYPRSSADGYLREADVLLAIDGHPIANDGSIELDGLSVITSYSIHYTKLYEDQELARRGRDDVGERVARSLRRFVELADRLDLVAQQLV